MTHKSPQSDNAPKPAPQREHTLNGGSQRQRQNPTEAYENGPGQRQREHTNIPDPRDLERDPAGTMQFPGAHPDEPAKKLAGGQSLPEHHDETPGGEPELSGDPDQPRAEKAPNRRP